MSDTVEFPEVTELPRDSSVERVAASDMDDPRDVSAEGTGRLVGSAAGVGADDGPPRLPDSVLSRARTLDKR
jgi:hypothetical protein